jgi:hypothetical protein
MQSSWTRIAILPSPMRPNEDRYKDDAKVNDDLLESLQQDKLVAWVKNHCIEPQGKCATKKRYVLSMPLSNGASVCFTDILKVIAAALKTEHPMKP